jgi:hypothetical protein
MAKKTNNTVEEKEREAIQEEAAEDTTADGFKFDTDFDVEDEFKVPPLVPAGRYEGYVTGVHFDAGDQALVWDVTLKADDVMMSDNETPVSGNVMVYKNWFPKAGDESVRTKTGKMTKRQAKINMIQEFQKKMRINMNTPDAILNGVQNAEWIGLEVIVVVEIREWEGRTSNQIKEMFAA